MRKEGGISIWFFIGVSLLVNGFLIAVAGLYELAHPPAPEHQVVLYSWHANIWWGAVLFLIGAFYCVYFNPRKHRES